MSNQTELAYRDHLSTMPHNMRRTFDDLLPSDATSDDPATRLTRSLIFEPARYRGSVFPSFAERLPYMVDHGVRQATLAVEVLADDTIRHELPDWFDTHQMMQASMAADSGLTFVSTKEVETVHTYGPHFAQDYANHPEYGYGMAEAIGTPDEQSQKLAAFIARHHMLQARNPYGKEWCDIQLPLAHPEQVDLMVVLQKPFDYIDDCVDTPGSGKTFETAVNHAVNKLVSHFGHVLYGNLPLVTAFEDHDVAPYLPNRIAYAIRDHLLDPGSEIAAAYGHYARTL